MTAFFLTFGECKVILKKNDAFVTILASLKKKQFTKNFK